MSVAIERGLKLSAPSQREDTLSALGPPDSAMLAGASIVGANYSIRTPVPSAVTLPSPGRKPS